MRFDDADQGLVARVDPYQVALQLACGDYTEPMSDKSTDLEPDDVFTCQRHGERQLAIGLQVYLYEQMLGPVE